MAKNYAQRVPLDRDDHLMAGSHPPFTALASYGSLNQATSSAFGLTTMTTVVEVTATTAAALVKWGNSVIGVAPTDFDTAVAAGTSRLLVVPRFRAASTSIQGINRMEGLYSHMAVASYGPGSVLAAEY